MHCHYLILAPGPAADLGQIGDKGKVTTSGFHFQNKTTSRHKKNKTTNNRALDVIEGVSQLLPLNMQNCSHGRVSSNLLNTQRRKRHLRSYVLIGILDEWLNSQKVLFSFKRMTFP